MRQPRGFLGFICEVERPSEADVLTGNDSDRTTNGCSFHGQDARAVARAFSFGVGTVGAQLFGQCFGFTGTPNDLLPKPMGKHDPLLTVVRSSGPRGCAILMHTKFGLTRKSLSKFTGMPKAAWVQTQRVPLKSHRESYRLDLVVLVK